MLIHRGLTFLNYLSATLRLCLDGKNFREKISAVTFSADGIHLVLIFMDCSSRNKCVPCAHRSKGKIGQRAISIQALAEKLSSVRKVYLPEQNLAKVSHVIKAAKNSAWLIFTEPGERSLIFTTLSHSSHLRSSQKSQKMSKIS